MSKLSRLDEKTASAASSSYVCAATVCRRFRDVDDMNTERNAKSTADGLRPAAGMTSEQPVNQPFRVRC